MSGGVGVPGRERENVSQAPVLVTTLRLETTNALTVRIPTLCHNRSDLSTFIATCGQWTDWEKSPDSPYTNIRTRECTEECDEGQINLRFVYLVIMDCHPAVIMIFPDVQTTGASGAPGAPAVTRVVAPTPGPATV